MSASVETEIAALLDQGAADDALTLAWRTYAPEILGYLAAVLHDEDDARETLARAGERLWKSLDGYRRESTFRAWAYRVAFNEAMMLVRSRGRRRELRLATEEALELPVGSGREATPPHRQTTIKERIAGLRLRLDADEQTLLTLRVDRDLSWGEISHILGEGDAATEPALRKRFERVKRRLRDLAVAEGILPPARERAR